MKKSRNLGLSFVEIVLSVVIFGILMAPIVSKLIQSMKTADTAKVAQNRYELAENLMENVKNSDEFTVEKVSGDAYLNQISTGGVTVLEPSSLYTASGNACNGYAVVGSTKIGKKEEVYNYAIVLDNGDYADKAVADSNYKNPNDMSLATIESLDADKVALINGTIGNYDMTVTTAFMSKKLDILKVGDRSRWEQYTKQQADIVAFPNDTVTRVIEVSVTDKDENGAVNKNPSTGETIYTVSCKLNYKENSSVVLKDGEYAGKNLSDYLSPIEYLPYKHTFEGELPNIYLMYNPCLYNNNYMENDYIMLDTSTLTTGTKVNLFIVETAETFSTEAAAAYKDITNEDVAGKALINTATLRDRKNVKVNFIGKSNGGVATTDDVTIYHNFDGDATVTTDNKHNSAPVLTNQHPIDVSTSDYYTLDSTQLKDISSAVLGASYLYKVKIYLTKKNLDTSSYGDLLSGIKNDKISPVLTGTKGGN